MTKRWYDSLRQLGNIVTAIDLVTETDKFVSSMAMVMTAMSLSKASRAPGTMDTSAKLHELYDHNDYQEYWSNWVFKFIRLSRLTERSSYERHVLG